MTKTLVDPRIKAKLDQHTAEINHARPSTGHRIGPHMRDALTGYGECLNVPCRAGFNLGYPVGVANAEPIITDDNARGTKCPVTEFWEISGAQGGGVEYSVKEFRTQAAAMATWAQTGPGHRLAHISGASHTVIGQK